MSVSRDAATAQEPGADLLSAAFLEAGFSHIAVQNTRTPAYEATTIDQIAAAVGVTSHAVGRYFATKDAIILSIVDDIVVAVAIELARISPQTSPLEALLAADTAVISDIADGAGVITRERMQALAHILTASLDLRRRRPHSASRCSAMRSPSAWESDPRIRGCG